MKKLIYILPFLFAINCFGQTETKEDFVNAVSGNKYFLNFSDNHYFLQMSDSFYYLLEDAKRINLSGDDLKKDEEYVKTIIPAAVAKQLFAKIISDTFTEKWNCGQLKRAKCLEDISNKPENFCCHCFSKPIFDDRRQYAIIKVGNSYKSSVSHGGYDFWLFTKKKGKWQRVTTFGGERY